MIDDNGMKRDGGEVDEQMGGSKWPWPTEVTEEDVEWRLNETFFF